MLNKSCLDTLKIVNKKVWKNIKGLLLHNTGSTL